VPVDSDATVVIRSLDIRNDLLKQLVVIGYERIDKLAWIMHHECIRDIDFTTRR